MYVAAEATAASATPAAVITSLTQPNKNKPQQKNKNSLEALRWIHFLLVRNEDEVFGQLAALLAALLDALGSSSERVVLQALSVLGSIAAHPRHFRRVLTSLLDRCVRR